MMRKIVAGFGAGIMGALLLVGAGSAAWADSPKDCAKRVQHAEKNLRDAERKHGRHSRQAAQRRREVEQARMKCSM